MSSCSLVVNGRKTKARTGQTLLDAAMKGGIVIPHDCATGQCNTCRVRIFEGAIEDGGTRHGNTVLACRAKISNDLIVEFDEVPEVVKRRGSVRQIVDFSADIAEVTVILDQRLAYLPGQYVKVRFHGFPDRELSPSLHLDGSAELDELVFHMRRQINGRVSSALGSDIKAGTRVDIQGPYGQAYHRAAPSRLVLVSAGVGWAPIWAVARASRLREPERAVHVVAGAGKVDNLYMRPCLDWLGATGAHVTLTCSGADVPPDVRAGRTTLYLPTLTTEDTVVVAGAPGMVAAVEIMAKEAGARCYADPFLPAGNPVSLRTRLLGSLKARLSRSNP